MLDGAVDPVRAAVFLIALRMKRETDDENLGILDAVLETTTTVTASVGEVVDLSDPYNGFNRNLPVSAFLPAVLAACGVPAISHGVESMGPKFGATPPTASSQRAEAPVASTRKRWAPASPTPRWGGRIAISPSSIRGCTRSRSCGRSSSSVRRWPPSR